VPEDHIARIQVFLRGNPQTEGFSVRNQKLSGAYVKLDSQIGLDFLLILVKFVENCRKIRKTQLNFAGFLVKNPTTLVKHDHTFS
jgi:hypothetical protein